MPNRPSHILSYAPCHAMPDIILCLLKHLHDEIAEEIQLTLFISNSLISNNRLSRSENLVPVLIQRSTNRQQNIVEKRRNCFLGAISRDNSFPQYFHYISNLGVKIHIILLMVVVRLIVFLSSVNLIRRSTDISKCFIESLGVRRDNESRLCIVIERKGTVIHIMY